MFDPIAVLWFLAWLISGVVWWRLWVQQRQQAQNLTKLHDDFRRLRQSVELLKTKLEDATSVAEANTRVTPSQPIWPPRPPPLPVLPGKPPFANAPPRPEPEAIAKQSTALESPATAPAATIVGPPPARPGPRPALPAPSIFDRGVQAIRNFFTGGNAVVRLGIVVLFFGLAFLLKYASDRYTPPIEWRLSAVALTAIGLLIVGWRLRLTRPGFGLALQGGAVAGLYLTVFSALRLFAVLPAGAAFALLTTIAVSAALLAAKQNSLSLAMLGTAGGFFAPVLASTGQGNHVGLFSYYASLNCGVVTLAWFKAWRPLNLLAFLGTFGVGTLWGVTRYDPRNFSTTEPFLLLFFLMFVLIAILFAWRAAPQLNHYVDGTIVFGTPVVAMGLQAALVRDFQFGQAYSALFAAGLYLGLAAWLRRRAQPTLKLLVESFIALGVAFATLAVPLALDGRWTAATWALEGAAIFWVGLRQRRRLPVFSGPLLQLAGGIAFLAGASSAARPLPIANSVFIGAVLLAAAGIFSAWLTRAPVWPKRARLPVVSALLLTWGLGWWLSGIVVEISHFVPYDHRRATLLLALAATALIAEWGGRRYDWPALAVVAYLLLPVLVGLGISWAAWAAHPFAHGGWLAWPLSLAAFYWILQRVGPRLPQTWVEAGHVLGLWFVVLLASWQLNWWLGVLTAPGGAWAGAATALAGLGVLTLLGGQTGWTRWPLNVHRPTYVGMGAAGIAGGLLLWSLHASLTNRGSALPLPYLTLLNPADLSQAAALMLVARWWPSGRNSFAWSPSTNKGWRMVFWLTLFAALNSVLLRSLHHYSDVAYTPSAWLNVPKVQTALSIFWTLLALALMLFATRRGYRMAWLAGATLMAVVVAKLFLVDLARVGTIERIVSFIVVGVLMLVIGYFSPLPPARSTPEKTV